MIRIGSWAWQLSSLNLMSCRNLMNQDRKRMIRVMKYSNTNEEGRPDRKMYCYSVTAKYVKCPSCGADVLSTTRFCVNCGAQMPGQRTCPHCKAPVTGKAEFCRSCGKSLQPTRKCPKCNLPISGNPEFCRNWRCTPP